MIRKVRSDFGCTFIAVGGYRYAPEAHQTYFAPKVAVGDSVELEPAIKAMLEHGAPERLQVKKVNGPVGQEAVVFKRYARA